MTAAPTTLSTLSKLRGLLEATRLARDEHDLTRLCDRIAETISASLGFRTVAINLYRPAEGDYRVTTVHGNDHAREALLGSTRRPDAWTPFLTERFYRRGAYLIVHDQVDWERVPSYVPDIEIGTEPDAWHPEDALIVPMRGSDGTLLGVVSVDEPESGLRPSDEELDVLVAFAEHVTAAIEAAQTGAAAARDRAALAQLLDISASLVELDSVESVLSAVARGIEDALGFEKVAILLTDETGHYTPAGTAGWPAGDPALDISFQDRHLDVLFVPEFEVEGCYLIECDVANSLVANGSTYKSQRNGSGAGGWNRHWLLVPLVERDGARRGFIWVDDPSDCLLPSPQRLQALRTFANQATVALRAAYDFELLNARNRELAGLHATAVGLLERLDLDSVLHAIVDNARQLVGTEHAYLYLASAGGSLRMRVGLGLFESHVGRVVQPGRGASGKVLVTGETVVIDDYRDWSDRLDDYDEIGFRAVVGVPLRSDGRVVGVIGIARREALAFERAEIDLLDRFARLAELALANASLYAALEQSETLHREIVEASTDMICLVGLDGGIEMISPSAKHVLGRTPEELVGTSFGDLVHPDDLEAAYANFAEAMTAPTSMTVRGLHADGSPVKLEATTLPLTRTDGSPERILATVRDVTERHRLEEQLRQAQKMESIGRLAGGIAHDFNNLLTAIRGYAELLLLDLPDDLPARESAKEIARAAERAASLTGQLLAFSRKQVLRPQRLDLNEVVGGMSTMLSRVLGEDVVLTTALETELWPTLADPTQVEQVVLNLAVNARDAMPGGGRLTVRTANVELDDGPHVALVVADTGTGMDAHTAAQIFEPFFTTKDVGAGTGLGLATVHGIVAQTGGSVDVTSELGVGTTFTVCLPRAA